MFAKIIKCEESGTAQVKKIPSKLSWNNCFNWLFMWNIICGSLLMSLVKHIYSNLIVLIYVLQQTFCVFD